MTQFNVQQLMEAYGGGNIVKSVQNISVTIASGNTSGTATITGVVAANSFFLYGGYTAQVAATHAEKTLPAGVLTNGTTVTASRNTSDTNTVTLYGAVIEFQAGVLKSNQSGTVILASTTSNTGTISSVVTGNSVVVYQGNTTTDDISQPQNVFSAIALTNSTTVTASMGGTSSTLTQYYTVLEFNAGILNSSTQSAVLAMSTSQTSQTATITGVTAANTMIVWGGFTSDSAGINWTGISSGWPWITLTNGTTITAARTVASGETNLSINCMVLEFKASAIKSMNRGSIVIASSASSNTATITAVNTSLTAVNYLGQTASADSSNTVNQIVAGNTLTNGTTVTTQTNSTSSLTRTVGYEAIEFHA